MKLRDKLLFIKMAILISLDKNIEGVKISYKKKDGNVISQRIQVKD